MADRDYEEEKEHEKEINEGPDPITNAARLNTEEDVISEKEIASAAMEQDSDLDDEEVDREQRAELARARSYATETSVASAPPDAEDEYRKKPWYKKLNPLRWGGIKPVPQERTVCPESEAGFFNKLFFQWQASLMTVSGRTCP